MGFEHFLFISAECFGAEKVLCSQTKERILNSVRLVVWKVQGLLLHLIGLTAVALGLVGSVLVWSWFLPGTEVTPEKSAYLVAADFAIMGVGFIAWEILHRKGDELLCRKAN